MALQIKDLSIIYRRQGEELRAVSSVSLSVGNGEVVGVVGESGCGKSTLALSLMRLLPENARVESGQIFSDDIDLLSLDLEAMRKRRGGELAMIFQDPFTALNPVFRVGDQIAESLEIHRGLTHREALQEASQLMEEVEIQDPARRAQSYPHELSGGERQRVMIAIAIAGRPKLLIADEPTTALDVTVQREILDLLKKLQREFGMSILLITHNFGLVAELCHRVAVMYAGRIVEEASREAILKLPLHPYTKALLQSIPRLGHRGALQAIPGRPPDLHDLPRGCTFAPRCTYRIDSCEEAEPKFDEWQPAHRARCIRVREIS